MNAAAIVKAKPRGRTLPRLYPEVDAGGFARNDQRVTFYTRINALLRPSMNVLEFGAGRGRHVENDTGYVRTLTTIKGKCINYMGCDVDRAVLLNPLLEHAYVTEPGKPLPFPTHSINMVISFAVFEHLDDPDFYARELERVLVPGGWICAWTPNKWSYFAMSARLVPNSLHARVLRLLRSDRTEADIFPTVYKLNTLADIRRHFPVEQFEHYSYIFSGPPAYDGGRMTLAWLWSLWNKLLPSSMGQYIHIFLRKRGSM